MATVPSGLSPHEKKKIAVENYCIVGCDAVYATRRSQMFRRYLEHPFSVQRRACFKLKIKSGGSSETSHWNTRRDILEDSPIYMSTLRTVISA
jgi:hypothetical protein